MGNDLETIKTSLAKVNQMRCLLGTIIALVIADGLITQFLVTSRLGREWNPFLQTFVGGENFLIIKMVGSLLGAFILWEIYRKHPMVALISTLCFIVLYTGIVYWNLGVFFVTQL